MRTDAAISNGDTKPRTSAAPNRAAFFRKFWPAPNLRLLRLRDGRHIVAISAGPMVMLRAGTSVYSPSKFAVVQLVHVLAPKIEHRGIAVNSLMFGTVLPPALTNAGAVVIAAEVTKTPFARVAELQNIADVVALSVSDDAPMNQRPDHLTGGGML